MTRRLDIRTGATGYRDQLDRVLRYLGRVHAREGDPNQRFIVDYQDDVWSFFQNCWHLKDWIRHDPLIPEDVKARIKGLSRIHPSSPSPTIWPTAPSTWSCTSRARALHIRI